MEVNYEIFLIIVGCGIVTLLPRVLPLMLLSKFKFPQWYKDWLSFIPVTIMAALVAQEVIPEDGNVSTAFPAIIASGISW
ncbi:AzlD domain-containing protein [Solimicrobium silvestre]|uniref:Branched-chain amino acid transport protein (AzlD) n=1 Tax=Solimicrobium silvestre TaxID=2099400 RepID=A0A2S9H3X9_9BURK|nr:AzlD domain-containing protein [Solimicrobium silvestre]PRC94576.1 Branched-chain amino acid transport protein (AzlD) [Solimicrobium silvestre]